MARAARDGFDGVEILFPYDQAPTHLAHLLRVHRLELVLINTPPGVTGENGLACLPGREADFAQAMQRALAVCGATGCRAIHAMAGTPPAETDPVACRATLIDNLRQAAKLAGQEGVTLTLEALNHYDIPGYFYSLPDQVVQVIQAVDHPTVRLQFDFYHSQREGLNLDNTLRRLLPWVHHVQFAHAQGRHEPDPAEPAVVAALRTLAAAGYTGWIGCEYRPRGDTTAGLGWREAYQAAWANLRQPT